MDQIEDLDYKYVYDSSYYRVNYPKTARLFGMTEESLLNYFVKYGMMRGHQGSTDFNVWSYRLWNPDLDFGDDLKAYYVHYIEYGHQEHRVAVGAPMVKQRTVWENIDYSDVYKFDEYVSFNTDVWKTYGFQPDRVLQHFVEQGMKEGRKAYLEFDVHSYRVLNPDLEKVFGDDWERYYLHYLEYGKREGRKTVR